jgi:hypothetical protein
LREDAVAETIGMGTSYGRKPIRDSSSYYCLFLEKGEPRAESRTFLDEPIVAVWYADLTEPGIRRVREVFRFESVEGEISRLSFYGFCPDAESEVLNTLRIPVFDAVLRDLGAGVHELAEGKRVSGVEGFRTS